MVSAAAKAKQMTAEKKKKDREARKARRLEAKNARVEEKARMDAEMKAFDERDEKLKAKMEKREKISPKKSRLAIMQAQLERQKQINEEEERKDKLKWKNEAEQKTAADRKRAREEKLREAKEKERLERLAREAAEEERKRTLLEHRQKIIQSNLSLRSSVLQLHKIKAVEYENNMRLKWEAEANAAAEMALKTAEEDKQRRQIYKSKKLLHLKTYNGRMAASIASERIKQREEREAAEAARLEASRTEKLRREQEKWRKHVHFVTRAIRNATEGLYLTAADISRCECVCKIWREYLSHSILRDSLWKQYIKKRWKNSYIKDLETFKSPSESNWKFVYIGRYVSERLGSAIRAVKPPKRADFDVCNPIQLLAPDGNILVHSRAAQPEAVTWLDEQLSRPLQYPSIHRQIESLMKHRNLDIHYTGETHGTLLMKAITWGNLNLVKFLLEQNVSVAPQSCGMLNNLEVASPLQWAIRINSYMKRTRVLISKGLVQKQPGFNIRYRQLIEIIDVLRAFTSSQLDPSSPVKHNPVVSTRSSRSKTKHRGKTPKNSMKHRGGNVPSLLLTTHTKGCSEHRREHSDEQQIGCRKHDDYNSTFQNGKLTLINLRKSLREAISNAEINLDEELEEAKNVSDERVERHRTKVESVIEYYDLQMTLKQQSAESVSNYLDAIRTKDLELCKARSTIKIAKDLLVETSPQWLKLMQEAADIAEEFGYKSNTWWRPRCYELTEESVKLFENQYKEDAKNVVIHQKVLLSNINVGTSREFRKGLLLLIEECKSLEFKQNIVFRTKAMDVKVAERVLENTLNTAKGITSITAQNFEESKNIIVKELATRSSSYVEQQVLDLEASIPNLNRILDNLERECDNSLRVNNRNYNYQYIVLLKEASVSGAWRDGLLIYRSMVHCRLYIESQVYMLLIVACKNAKPVQAAMAVEIFWEMHRTGLGVTVKDFNVVMDACRRAGHWRRALVVFQSMADFGVCPNTATYSVVGDACAHTPLEDAPLVYEAMKYAGVPEFIAYSTARNAIYGGGKDPNLG